MNRIIFLEFLCLNLLKMDLLVHFQRGCGQPTEVCRAPGARTGNGNVEEREEVPLIRAVDDEALKELL